MNKGFFPIASLRGFTLVEVLISLAIMGMMMTILLANYPETAVRLTLANISHRISLLAREAQVRGSAIDSSNSSIGGYGIYAVLASPRRVILFGDTVDANVPKPFGVLVGNGLYETSPVDEAKSLTNLPNGYTIARLCVGNSFPFSCNDPTVLTLTVSFTRPNPQPNIYINGSSATSYSAGCIELHSPRAPNSGHIRSVQVFTSGMIRSQLGKCDNS
jgi:prepilin-type N-terminal cleavage/methylation domain-containing protein